MTIIDNDHLLITKTTFISKQKSDSALLFEHSTLQEPFILVFIMSVTLIGPCQVELFFNFPLNVMVMCAVVND